MTIGIITALIFILAVAALVLLPTRRLGGQAERDFNAARGSQHRRQLEQALVKTGQRLITLETEHTQIKRQLQESQVNEAREIDRSLAKHLISTRLIEVPGVGRVRAQAIKDGIFRGQLSDLHNSHLINGVGPETQSAISTWVRRMEADWQALRRSSFPEKSHIEQRFAAERQSLGEQQHRIEQRLTRLNELMLKGRSGLQQLSSVSSDNFRRALGQPSDSIEAERLQRYMLGLFAPWEPVPAWYAELLTSSELGEESGHDRS